VLEEDWDMYVLFYGLPFGIGIGQWLLSPTVGENLVKMAARGLRVDTDDRHVVIRLDKEFAGPLLSVLLHSKFSDGLRIEFLTTPYANALIEALLPVSQPHVPAADRLFYDEEDSQTFDRVREFVTQWAADEGYGRDQTEELIQLALYPWTPRP
jgi:hypothetical protein